MAPSLLSSSDAEGLELLLKVQSKEELVELVQSAYILQDSIQIPADVVVQTAQKLDITNDQSQKLYRSMFILINQSLYHNTTDGHKLLPETFHSNLRGLLSRVLAENCPSWRNKSLTNQVSLPKLVDFSWRVDVKTSSNEAARMSVPTCILRLDVEGASVPVDGVVSTHTVELNKGTLDAMLDSLTKIRDQLDALAKR